MPTTLDAYLRSQAGADPLLVAAAETVRQLALAAIEVRDTIISGGGGGQSLGAASDDTNGGGDIQKVLDVVADRVFLDAAKASPVAFYGSEEQDEAVAVNAQGMLALAIDPLDGSSNIDTNVSIGTIFSLLPVTEAHRTSPEKAFLQPGANQVAAGFFVYGPQLLLVLSLGKGTQVHIYSPDAKGFVEMRDSVSIPPQAKEYAINSSNHRHWDASMRAYVEDLLAGSNGARGRDFNMRWIGSMVADCYRILVRGGVFLYPGDARKGYGEGRLRLLYEANPIAFCIENAGGSATNGTRRVLDIVPERLHMRTPLVFGAKDEVAEVGRYLSAERATGEGSLAQV